MCMAVTGQLLMGTFLSSMGVPPGCVCEGVGPAFVAHWVVHWILIPSGSLSLRQSKVLNSEITYVSFQGI